MIEGRNAYNQRLWVLAPEIGRFRPAAQEKAINLLMKLYLGDHDELHIVLGLTRSRVVAERLRAEWQASPAHWEQFSRPFAEGLQEYAPLDLALPKLHGPMQWSMCPVYNNPCSRA